MSSLHKVTLPSGSTYDLEGTLLSITGTQTSATNAWTGSTVLEELKAGVVIAYYLPKDGTTTAATLNLTLVDGTTTGAKSIYFEGTTPVKQQFKAGSLIIMQYDGSSWHTINYTDTNTDTKNTAGTDDTSSKIFLVGATAQTAANANGTGRTYTHDTVFVDTNDYLNSKTPTSTSENSTVVATTAFVQNVINGLPTPMQFKGTVGTNGTITWANLPSPSSIPPSSNVGWTYKVIEAHATAPVCIVGDTIISNGTEWVVIPSGDDPGTVDTWRNVKVNGTEQLGSSINTGAVDFVNGTNTTVTFKSTGNEIAVNATSTDTYSSTETKLATGKTIANAIGTLDVTGESGIAATKTISAWSETDGKVSITTQDITFPSVGITNSGSGNAVTSITASGHQLTVTKGSTFLTAHQTIKQDGVTGATVNRFGTCGIAAGTAAKTASITTGTFSLEAGAQVAIKFTYANTASSPTLNIGSTGAKNIYYKGAQITTGKEKNLLAGTCVFIYDGTQYHLIGGGSTFEPSDLSTDTVLKTSDANKTTLSDTTTNIVSAQGAFTAGDYPVTFSVSNETLAITNGTKPSLGNATTKKINNYVTVTAATTTPRTVYAPPAT